MSVSLLCDFHLKQFNGVYFDPSEVLEQILTICEKPVIIL